MWEFINALAESAEIWFSVWAGAAWRGFILLGVAGLSVLSMKKASAALRHWILLLAMGSLLALPILSTVLPGWSVLPAWPGANRVAPKPEPFPKTPTFVTPLPSTEPVSRSLNAATLREQQASTARSARDPSALPSAPRQARHMTAYLWTLLGWGLGLVVCAIPACAGWVSLWSLQRHSERATQHPALPHIKRLTRHLRIRRRVQLYLGPQTLMPMVWGIFKIRLALPQGVDKWNEERLRLVLLHELAHAKRHDFLSHTLTRLVCALYWFNPLVWWAAHRMTLDREHACDDLVLMQGSDPGDYAGELLQVVAELDPAPRLGSAAVAMARSSKLEARIRSILDGGVRRRVTRTAVIVCTTMVVGMSLTLATLQPAGGAEQAAHDPARPTGASLAIDPGMATVRLAWQRGGQAKSDMPAFGQNIQLLASKIPLKRLDNMPGLNHRYARLLFPECSPAEFFCGISQSTGALDEHLFDIFFIDLNGDGEITTDETLQSEPFRLPSGNLWDCHYGAMDIPLNVGSTQRVHTVFFSRRSDAASGELYAQAFCYMTGTILSGQRKKQIVLIDNNCDGRFNTSNPSPRRCDFLWIDDNDDGKIEYTERRYIGGFLWAQGEYLRIVSSRDGLQLQLQPYTGMLGRITTSLKNATLHLHGPTAPLFVRVENDSVLVPAGTYDVDRYTLQVVDAEGETWTLTGFSGWLDKVLKQGIDVGGNETVKVPLGFPYVSHIEAEQSPSRKHVDFELIVTGQGGERIRLSNSKKSSPARPTLQIRDANGKIVQKARESGRRAAASRYYWSLESNVAAGQYSVEAQYPAWPVEISDSGCLFDVKALESGGDRRDAAALTPVEKDLLDRLTALSKGLDIEYPNRLAHWEARRTLYQITSRDRGSVWSVLDLVPRRWEDDPNTTVGWGSSRRTDAEADYYLVDGTPLQSWWKQRDNSSMHNISIDTGRPVSEGERVRIIVRRAMDSDRILKTQTGDRSALRFYVRSDGPQGIIIWLDKSLRTYSQTLGDAEILHKDSHTELTWLLPEASVDTSHLLWFTEESLGL